MDINAVYREISENFFKDDALEDSLLSGLRCLKKFLPADRLHFSLYDPDMDHLKIIAMTTEEGMTRTNRVLPFSKATVNKLLSSKGIPTPFSRLKRQSVHKEIVDHDSKWDDYCGAAIDVEFRGIIGSTAILAFGEDRYNDKHLCIIAALKPLFSRLLFDLVHQDALIHLQKHGIDITNSSVPGKPLISVNEIIGSETGLRSVIDMANQVALFDSPVILLGETGVGKKMIARLIHQVSDRRTGPFVPVNCGAIPESLIDSELFGHEKGAFTGAVSQKRGLFEMAEKGTVFLDEIGEMPLAAQIRMLRVLQEKRVQKVGSSSQIEVDIRIIAATHRNLDEMIGSGAFRSDLWFRLHVFTIMIPPLRERKGDIPLLVEHFLEKKSKQMRIPVPLAAHPDTLMPLMDYDWPGNVRELENVVERALILSRGQPLAFHRIVRGDETNTLPPSPLKPGENLSLDSVTANHIRNVLKLTKGKINGPGGAAEKLGINPATLRNRMNKLQVPYGRGIYSK